jgi:tetratricopeptide (TPR) repeat protein
MTCRFVFVSVLFLVVCIAAPLKVNALETLTPGDAFVKGYQFLQKGRHEAAQAAFESCLERISPDNPWRIAVQYQLALALFAQQQYRQALPHFEAVTSAFPDRGDAGYLYAKALLFSGDPDRALPAFSRAEEADPSLAEGCRYYSGVAYLQILDYSRAETAFKAVVSQGPESPYGLKATEILDVMKEEARTQKRKASPFKGFVTISATHDTNLTLLPDNTPVLPASVTSERDQRIALNTGGGYEFLRTAGLVSGINADYFGTRHRRNDDYDMDQLSGEIYLKKYLKPVLYTAGITFTHMWLDSDDYYHRWGAYASASPRLSDWSWLRLGYAHYRDDFQQTPPYPEEDRDAGMHDMSLSINFLFSDLLPVGRKTYLSLAAGHQINDSDGRSYQYSANSGSVVLVQDLPLNMKLQGSFHYQDFDYDHPNIRSLTEERRDDEARTFHVRLVKHNVMGADLFISYMHYRNDSNIPDFYEYDTNTYTIGMRYDF